MSTFTLLLIWLSSLSFLGYGIGYFVSPKLQEEFKRFGLAKFGPLTGALEILGAVGLLLGLWVPLILLLASAGLTLLMLLGFGVRLKIKDGFWASLPSFLFMLLNAYIFYEALRVYQ
ncbi:DoxX family protein [Hymenobacter psychrophilus]|uniref:DoxX-like family protein n=1 Tax=Hymenobacter psychrophilus TaxID=651662 RepID=A0A1H3KH09_9BACT|nr:DoxX family protein [Hymenobacter psychrophilus]SDY51386.1 DoxX-like family protein [Hymenobacter psychrophilus]